METIAIPITENLLDNIAIKREEVKGHPVYFGDVTMWYFMHFQIVKVKEKFLCSGKHIDVQVTVFDPTNKLLFL